MPKQKDFTKHPIKYFLEEFEPLLENNGEKQLLEKIKIDALDGVLRLNCFDDLTYQKLNALKELIPESLANRLGLKKILIRYDGRYAVLTVVDNLRSQGVKEFTIAQLQPEIEKLAQEVTLNTIKNILLELSLDISVNTYPTIKWPKWFVSLRKLYPYPMIEKIKTSHYKVLEKRQLVKEEDNLKSKSKKKLRS